MWLKRISLVLALLVLTGCGSGETVQAVTPPANRAASILESVAKTGVRDSGLVIVREELEKMKATDAAKAEALLNDLAQLEQARDAGSIKAKAKAMADKL
jgi:uncharacterized lipoprotein YajG